MEHEKRPLLSTEDHSQVAKVLDQLTSSDVTDETEFRRLINLPDKVGKFRIEQLLACHGQATVLLATDTLLNRKVVIKLYHPSARDPVSKRILNEGRVLARIKSPYVADCYSVDEYENGLMLVLEYVDGQPLSEILEAKKQLDAHQCVDIVRQIASGLQPAHDLKLLHRDLKPSNVMIRKDGRAKVIDFGLVRVVDSEETEPTSGTPAYMSPETASGDSASCSERTDIFGLGSILYHMLTGYPPFVGKDKTGTRELARKCEIAPIERTDVPDKVRSFCMKCLAKDPQNRYASLAEATKELDRISRPLITRLPKCLVGGGLLVAISILGYFLFGRAESPESYRDFRSDRDQVYESIEELQLAIANSDWDAANAHADTALAAASKPDMSPHFLKEVEAWADFVSDLESNNFGDANTAAIIAQTKIVNGLRVKLEKRREVADMPNCAQSIERAVDAFGALLIPQHVQIIEANRVAQYLYRHAPNADKQIEKGVYVLETCKNQFGDVAYCSLVARTMLADEYRMNRRRKDSIDLTKTAIEIAKTTATAPAQYLACIYGYDLAKNLALQRQFDDSIVYLNQSNELAKKFPSSLNDELNYRRNRTEFSSNFIRDTTKAIEAGKAAKNIYERNPDVDTPERFISFLSELALAYSYEKTPEETKALLADITQRFGEVNSPRSLFVIKNNIANTRYFLKDYKLAYQLKREAMETRKEQLNDIVNDELIRLNSRLLTVALAAEEEQAAARIATELEGWLVDAKLNDPILNEIDDALANYYLNSEELGKAKSKFEKIIQRLELQRQKLLAESPEAQKLDQLVADANSRIGKIDRKQGQGSQ